MFRHLSAKTIENTSLRTLSQNSNLLISNSSSYSNRIEHEYSYKKNKKEELEKYMKIYSASTKKKENKFKKNLQMHTKLKESILKPNNLKYLPKGKILKNNVNFFNKTCYNFLLKDDKEKINKTNTKIILNKEFIRDLKKEINNHSETDLIKFRTEYILKYAKISDFLKYILTIYKNIFNNERKSYIGIYFSNEKKNYENLNRLILEEIKCDFPLEYLTWKNLISSFYEFNIEFTNIINFLFEEIKILQNKILELEQKLFEKENELNKNSEELNKVNDYIKKYDINERKKVDKEKELKISNLKIKQKKKENTYILTIYKLEEELKDLTKLLEQNKYEKKKLNIIKNENIEKKKEIDDLRNNLNKEINDMFVKITFLKDEIDSLKNERDILLNENKNLKEEIENKDFQISALNKDKEDLFSNLRIKENKITSLQDTISSLENKENEDNKKNDEINNFIDIPVLSVMTSSHNV